VIFTATQPATGGSPCLSKGMEVLAKFSEASRTWKKATVFKSEGGSTVTVCFDGYKDEVVLPVTRVKPATGKKAAQHAKKKGPARAPLQPTTQLPKATSRCEQALCTVRSCLSKLAPGNYDKLAAKVATVEVDNADTLAALVDFMYERAVLETHFTDIYARLFSHCAEHMPRFDKDSGPPLSFRRLLLSKAQREFESDRDRKLTDEERKRKLGSTLFVGHLWLRGLLQDNIVHGCVSDVLDAAEGGGSDSSSMKTDAVEVACTLVAVIGAACDASAAGCARMDTYMTRMATWVADKNRLTQARVRFKVMDVLDAHEKHRRACGRHH